MNFGKNYKSAESDKTPEPQGRKAKKAPQAEAPSIREHVKSVNAKPYFGPFFPKADDEPEFTEFMKEFHRLGYLSFASDEAIATACQAIGNMAIAEVLIGLGHGPALRSAILEAIKHFNRDAEASLAKLVGDLKADLVEHKKECDEPRCHAMHQARIDSAQEMLDNARKAVA